MSDLILETRPCPPFSTVSFKMYQASLNFQKADMLQEAGAFLELGL